MNHSPARGLHIRRIQLRPGITDTVFPHDPKAYSRTGSKDPLVFRRSYDISAACMRQSETADHAPISMHIRGESSRGAHLLLWKSSRIQALGAIGKGGL